MNAASAIRTAHAIRREPISDLDVIIGHYRDLEQLLISIQLAMHNQNPDRARFGFVKARTSLARLIGSIRPSSDPLATHSLRLLYGCWYGAVVDAERRQEPHRLAEILPVIAEVRCAWEQRSDLH